MKHISNIISRIFDKFANKKFNKRIQIIINTLYVHLLKIDLKEFKNIKEYKSLNELFTRKLIKKREFNKDDKIFISPCDSLITQSGKLEENTLLQIKGMPYKIDELLTQYIAKDDIKKLYNGSYINFYLSPKDYHRYHAPIDCTIKKIVHIPGKLYPVNIASLNKRVNLFVKNERLILECLHSSNRLFYIVLVGALNVGKIILNFENKINTNKRKNKYINSYEYLNLSIKKGVELGYFNMGSTIIMLWEKDMVNMLVKTNDTSKFSYDIAKINES